MMSSVSTASDDRICNRRRKEDAAAVGGVWESVRNQELMMMITEPATGEVDLWRSRFVRKIFKWSTTERRGDFGSPVM